MSTQQDIYAAGSESRPHMLNKENYVPWSSRLLRYVKSRPNGKLIHNSILNGLYVRKMIPGPGDANREVNVTETFHMQTDNELSDKELKQIEADDQAIQTILLGLPEDIYAVVDSFKLLKKSGFNEVDELKAERLKKTQDPLALMANSNNPYAFLAPQEYDLMAAAADLDEIEEVNENCILMANLQQTSTSGTQTDSAPVYDTDGSAECIFPLPEEVPTARRKFPLPEEVPTALAQVESRLVEYKEREVKYIEKIRTLEYYDKGKKECIESLRKELETLKQEKEVVDGKLAGLLTASKDLDNLIESQRSDKNKEGLGYTDVPPPIAQLYLSPKKDLSWTGLPECADDTVTGYSRSSPVAESTPNHLQNSSPSASETGASDSILSKPAIKFVKAAERPTTDKVETVKKPAVRYDELYRKTTKRDRIGRLSEDKKKQRNKKLKVSEVEHQV
nr:hypothetical protein [Tanacetum cinerariifolium]